MSPPSPPPSSQAAKAPLTGWGRALLIVGTVIAVPCGLCTSTLILLGIVDLAQNRFEYGYLQDSNVSEFMFYSGLNLLVGGLPTAVGVLLLLAGLKFGRKRS